jgi:diphosphomevalonate decarboxylase
MHASAIAHPNVALIKYWGKRNDAENLPIVGSMSVTLGALTTETTVEFDGSLDKDVLILNGQEQVAEHPRLAACMDALRRLVSDQRYAMVTSKNDFPTGAGLASSASGYAALVTAAAAAIGWDTSDARLLDIARIGSGSAPRSMFGGFVLLQNDDHGTVCEQLLRPDDWPLTVVVAVTSDAQKTVTSRVGMERSRLTSAYYDAWVETHAADLRQALGYVRQKDFFSLAEVAEYNCLKMHSVMMTTRPPLLYWLPETLACMRKVVQLRADGLSVFFTVDAGPQVKAVCLPTSTNAVADALREIPGVRSLIISDLGEGVRQVAR